MRLLEGLYMSHKFFDGFSIIVRVQIAQLQVSVDHQHRLHSAIGLKLDFACSQLDMRMRLKGHN
jgi:hypothetical protein